MLRLGVIGGSGLYQMDGLTDVREQAVETPFGEPSDLVVSGRLDDAAELCFLPRHGRRHRILPSEINHRANIFAMKLLEVDCVISVSAVGSLREDLRPRDVVLPDQYFDRTKQSQAHTFFGNGIVGHVAFGEPTCPQLRDLLAEVAHEVVHGREGAGVRVHNGGTYVNMEGPAFSTKAESNTYRRLGFDIIGMTSLPEAKLCREAELPYQPLAMVTDYDCWHETEEAVTVEMVIGHVQANTLLAKEIVKRAAGRIPEDHDWPCEHVLESALLTPREAMPDDTLEMLRPLLARFI